MREGPLLAAKRLGLRSVWSLIPPGRRPTVALIGLLTVLHGLLELASIGSVLPLLTDAAWVGVVLGAFLLARLAAAATIQVTYTLCARVRHEVASVVLRRTLERPYPWFLGRHSADLMETVIGDTDRVLDLVLVASAELLVNLTVAVFILAAIVWFAPLLALGAGALLGLSYGLLHRLIARRRLADSEAWRVAAVLRSQRVLESLATVKEARNPDFLMARFTPPSLEMVRLAPRLRLLGELPTMVVESLAILALGGVWSALGSGARLVVYVMAVWRLVPALDNVFTNLSRLSLGLPYVERVQAVLALPPAPPGLPEPVELAHSVRLEGVSWSYPGADTPVLRAVDFEIPCGRWVALTGPTGVGKTTLVDVVAGLLPPSSGRLLVDGREPDPAGWRRSVGYVPQEVFLLDDTVAANITFGEPVSAERLQAVARPLGLSELLERPAGERGKALSGGQRQRVGLARALYRQPRLVILDEATSGLDDPTEAQVLETLRGMTVLLVSHRASTVARCELVYRLEVAAGPAAQAGDSQQIRAVEPPPGGVQQG